MADRDRGRRSGVVYGAPLVRRADRPSLLGQAGSAVLGISIAVLVGAAVLGAGSASDPTTAAVTGTPEPSDEALASGPSDPLPTVPAVATPAPPTPSADAAGPDPLPPSGSPAPTLPAGLTPPPAAAGTGSLVFGRAIDGDGIAAPDTSFPISGRIAWVATLRDAQGPLPIVLEVHRLTDGASERTHRELVPAGRPDRSVVTRDVTIRSLIETPGMYELRYLRDGAELASGQVLITP